MGEKAPGCGDVSRHASCHMRASKKYDVDQHHAQGREFISIDSVDKDICLSD